jgi:hypothetical protein
MVVIEKVASVSRAPRYPDDSSHCMLFPGFRYANHGSLKPGFVHPAEKCVIDRKTRLVTNDAFISAAGADCRLLLYRTLIIEMVEFETRPGDDFFGRKYLQAVAAATEAAALNIGPIPGKIAVGREKITHFQPLQAWW